MALKKRHFTLIELLVVMGLIGLLVSLAVPSFTRLAKGKAVPAAADQIKRQLEEAQALAIANRSYVGLVIPNGTGIYYTHRNTTVNHIVDSFSGDQSSEEDFSSTSVNQYNLASTRPALLFKDGAEYCFDKWAPDSSWSKPVENVKIVRVDTSESSLFTSSGAVNNPVATTTTALNAGGNNTAFKRVHVATIRSRLEVAGATETSATLGPCAIVFSPDGGLASTQDLYLVIAGCTLNGSTITLNSGNSDAIALHINRVNGRISYYERQ